MGAICNRDCFNCPHPDCIVDELSAEEFKRSGLRDLEFREKLSGARAEYQRAYYQANKEKEAERQRAYYQANKEKKAEYRRAYYQANKEKKAEYRRAYRERQRQKKKREKEAEAPPCTS